MNIDMGKPSDSAHGRLAMVLAWLMAALALAGCGPRKDEADTLAPAIGVTDDVREELQRQAPDAVIGRVTAVRAQDKLVAVGDLPVDRLNVGDPMTFYGGRNQILGTGVIVAKTPDAVHVRYQPPRSGQRAPVRGDLAIRFTR